MRTDDFDYHLPDRLIAQHPSEQRDASRLLVVDRGDGAISHHFFYELPAFFDAGDLLILNNTRVLPARLYGRKASGGQVEILLLEEITPGRWEVLLKAGSKRPAEGSRLVFGDGKLEAELVRDGDMGRAVLRFLTARPFLEVLAEVGVIPLPPYIRREALASSPEDLERYQTVYARETGAVAAPTAGLHFTGDLFERLGDKGIGRAEVTLHVGIGTFRPVQVDDVASHRMDEERYVIPSSTAEAIHRVRNAGGRIVAVGTTTVRTLESCAADEGTVQAGSGRTDLFIYPPYRFKTVDAMITNFHLPKSTLLMMISAFAGRDLILSAYEEAIREEYRFYSYGDAMLIL